MSKDGHDLPETEPADAPATSAAEPAASAPATPPAAPRPTPPSAPAPAPEPAAIPVQPAATGAPGSQPLAAEELLTPLTPPTRATGSSPAGEHAQDAQDTVDAQNADDADEPDAPASARTWADYSHADLPSLVGAAPSKSSAPPPRPPMSARTKRIAIGAGVAATLITLLVILSWINSRDYYLVCDVGRVRAMRGSSFPWGRTELDGEPWRAIELRRESTCASRTLATSEELEEVFVRVLLDEASARIVSAEAVDIEVGERQLDQALLLTRASPTLRADIERLRGDVEYWRAASRIKEVLSALEDASRQFEKADELRPRSSNDARQWAEFAGQVASDLRKGPPDLRSDRDYGPDAPPPFAGTDTAPAPMRPESEPSGPTAAPRPTDAPPLGSARPPEPDAGPPPPARVDAGLPTGGVLL